MYGNAVWKRSELDLRSLTVRFVDLEVRRLLEVEQSGDDVGRHDLDLGVVLLHHIVIELAGVGDFLLERLELGLQAQEIISLTWDQVDLERGLLHLPERDMLLTNAVRRLLEKVQKVRSPGEDPHVLLSPQSRRPMDLARLSKVVQTALIRGGLENITLRDIRAAGGQREDDQTLLEWTRAHGSITRRELMALLNLSDTAAYLRLRRLVGRRELEQVGKKYYLPGTVVPEEKQWEVISAYLQEAGFAYCQDVAELLHVGKRKTAGILRRMVKDGRLLQFEKRYYLAKQPGQKQIQ